MRSWGGGGGGGGGGAKCRAWGGAKAIIRGQITPVLMSLHLCSLNQTVGGGEGRGGGGGGGKLGAI